MERLARARQTREVWASECPEAMNVGKIVGVKFVDISGFDRIEEKYNQIYEEVTDGGFESYRVERDLLDKIESTLDSSRTDDERAILVTVELPDGSRFGQLFSVPQTRDDRFYILCEKIVDDVGAASEVDGQMLIGEVVPLQRVRGRKWSIAPVARL